MTEPRPVPPELAALTKQAALVDEETSYLAELIRAARTAGHGTQQIAKHASRPVPYVRQVLDEPPGPATHREP